VEERILLLAQRGRDAQIVDQVLSRQGYACFVCASVEILAAELGRGAAAALVTEESLADADRRGLSHWLQAQPSWSDFPFILLATKRTGRRTQAAAGVLHQLANVVVLERPIHGETLASAAASDLRARRRQYEARRHLLALEAAEERLTQLNGTLETRIALRTQELARANDQLMQEIAERERAQAALVQSQKMEAVGQLTGGIAHDFNNLLTVIGGNLALIKRRGVDGKTTHWADNALQAADRATKLTRQLLAFSRTQRLTLRPVNINALIVGMNELLTRTIGPMLAIDMKLDPSEPWAMADANQVELAILNLAINARDAMPGGGAIDIASRVERSVDPALTPGDYVVISVIDRGEGIPAQLLDKVFDPFFTTKPTGKGTGLGLSQVFGIARQSGGTARIASTEGLGAKVEILLPATAAKEGIEAEAVANLPIASAPRARILVVEDDAGVRQLVVECLEALGYTTIEAAEGKEGLERLQADQPDLMIVDFAMPGINGVEVMMAARDCAPSLPVILATGYADMAAVSKVMDPGEVLRKPFQIRDLELAVRAALEKTAHG
jgi:signal transduction histidine kinase/CheY-like chemotaxis protein